MTNWVIKKLNAKLDHNRALNVTLLAALKRAQQMNKEAVSQFNWGSSALDAEAIRLLNDVPIEINNAIAAAEAKHDLDR